ncbi:hypothetical protein IEN91_05215 [Bacillus velezensis]|uniref:hypothetical protein n=1 Tax=Bacillus velezensis TaxID=492670 RepID=UPI0018C7EF73|nr:hypothetical protein [Bacillus velezensis]QPK89838.1 hypothetical protein IEN91_05215 [Bacillus velezensis]
MKESILLTLDRENILSLIKEKYPQAFHIELYIEYNDEGIANNDQIVAEVNIEDR